MTKKSLSFLLVATTLTIAAAQTSCTSQPRQDSESLKREAVLENIHQRKSVRDYTTQPVEDEKTNALLEAAMAAPSGKDTRPWHFVHLDGKARNYPRQLLRQQLLHAEAAAVGVEACSGENAASEHVPRKTPGEILLERLYCVFEFF